MVYAVTCFKYYRTDRHFTLATDYALLQYLQMKTHVGIHIFSARVVVVADYCYLDGACELHHTATQVIGGKKFPIFSL